MLGEADTRAKLIDPGLHRRGWTEDLIRREETAGELIVEPGRRARRGKGRVDYVLRVRVNSAAQPVAVAIIEAKPEGKHPAHGLEQAKGYAACRRLHVPFVYSSNGHLFVEFDGATGLTTDPRPLGEFPTPAELRERFEQRAGFRLDAPAAKPLLVPYSGGEARRRYYQDAAIRAVFEKIARGDRRALLALATGSGKTFIAVQLLRRIADAGQLRRALFVCDRDELRTQALGALQNAFGTDAASVAARRPEPNAKIIVATYQTLDAPTDPTQEGATDFLTKHYPPDYFSHIVIDECHRSAWGDWSKVLERNSNAVQVGLTATPRQLECSEKSEEARRDLAITADNIRYFGEPVYEYDLSQGIEDGYLAACEIEQYDLFHDNKMVNERESGVSRGDLATKSIRDARTGEAVVADAARPHYEASDLEDHLLLPERVKAMCEHLFGRLVDTGGPEQKTIVFCRRDAHADAVASAMNNLYAKWCAATGRARLERYAFKCTAASGGGDYLPDFRGGARHHFVATTVDLLTTGVDVPAVRNIVFFKYVRSPIAFYQMVGRGTRIDLPSEKLMFRVLDYTDATRLFGEEFKTKFLPKRERPPGPGTDGPDEPPEPTLEVVGFDIRVTPAGRYLLTQVDGRAVPVTVEEYRQRLAARLVEEAPTLDAFREAWVRREERRALLQRLPDGGRSADLVRALDDRRDYDLYDVLAEVGYGMAPRTRAERAEAFAYKHTGWLSGLPAKTSATVRALAAQFARGGTEGLENPQVFQTPEVARAGGLAALKAAGNPTEVLQDTKTRMFAA